MQEIGKFGYKQRRKSKKQEHKKVGNQKVGNQKKQTIGKFWKSEKVRNLKKQEF